MTDTMPRVTIAQIQQATAQHFGMTGWQVTGCRNRERTVARARQIAMYLAREMTEASYRQIAKRFGNRDHTTILHAVRLIRQLRKNNSYLAEHDTYIGSAIDSIISDLSH